MKRNKKIGLLWLILPVALLVICLLAFGIVQLVFNAETAETGNVIASVIRVILGFLGLVAVVLACIGIPMGIVYLNKKELDDNTHYDERSGKGDVSVIPAELGKWNWGAVFLTWIWGAYHGVWISFLTFVPFLNFVWWIVMGIKGNEWAWRKAKWESVEQFKKSQRKWAIWGTIIFVIGLLFSVISVILFMSSPNDFSSN